MLTHRNVVSNVLTTEGPEPFSESDVVLGLLPFYHIYAMVIVCCKALLRGTTIVSLPKFDLLPFLEILQNYKISRAHLVPPVILALAKHPAVANYDLTALRVVISGAAPLSKEVHHLFVTRFPSIVLKQGYGMTESSPVICVCPDNDVPPGSSGMLLANTEARVIDTQTGAELEVN
jgi:acyl-CoA synthetase (AMP-forming)/AMP-acid ligase II